MYGEKYSGRCSINDGYSSGSNNINIDKNNNNSDMNSSSNDSAKRKPLTRKPFLPKGYVFTAPEIIPPRLIVSAGLLNWDMPVRNTTSAGCTTKDEG